MLWFLESLCKPLSLGNIFAPSVPAAESLILMRDCTFWLATQSLHSQASVKFLEVHSPGGVI